MQYASYTLDEALYLYEKGYLTACGLVEMFFRITIKSDPSWSRSFTIDELSNGLGLSKRSIHRAISKCRVDGYLYFEIEGKIKFARCEDALEKVGDYNTTLGNTKSENTEAIDKTKALPDLAQSGQAWHSHDKLGSQDDKLGSQDDKPGSQDDKPGSQDDKPGTDAPLKPTTETDSSAPSSYIHLYLKSFSTLLQQKGVDFEKMKKFFEWWDKDGCKRCGFLIKNPIAYLNSEDPLIQEKRVFLKFAEWQKIEKEHSEILNDPELQRLAALYGD
jgi:DNA-binding transcriptional ArsR family regulator